MKMPPDMSRRQFRAALARRGWRQELLWITGKDEEGNTCGIGLVMTQNRGRWVVNYRASLAKAIRQLREEDHAHV